MVFDNFTASIVNLML